MESVWKTKRKVGERDTPAAVKTKPTERAPRRWAKSTEQSVVTAPSSTAGARSADSESPSQREAKAANAATAGG